MSGGAAGAARALLYLRALRRPLSSPRLSPASLGRPDDRMVFVFGSPRSGTTFLAGAIGSLPGFVDLGEVHPLKSALPELAGLEPEAAAPRLQRILGVIRRLGLVGPRRAVEQTPETAFVVPAVARAFPDATLVHLVRDGRDVVCSLLEQGWLSAARMGSDDAGAAYGAHARFWVEPGREGEFAAATEARRAAWAWRRYASSVLDSGVPVLELRYERLVSDPTNTAAELADALDVPAERVAAALHAARPASVGRHRRDLTPDQLEEVEREAGALLTRLGYLEAAEAGAGTTPARSARR